MSGVLVPSGVHKQPPTPTCSFVAIYIMGIDIVEPFEKLLFENINTYLLSKWAKAILFRDFTKLTVSEFIRNHIIYSLVSLTQQQQIMVSHLKARCYISFMRTVIWRKIIPNNTISQQVDQQRPFIKPCAQSSRNARRKQKDLA